MTVLNERSPISQRAIAYLPFKVAWATNLLVDGKGTRALDLPHTFSHRQFRRNRDHHMHMVGHIACSMDF